MSIGGFKYGKMDTDNDVTQEERDRLKRMEG